MKPSAYAELNLEALQHNLAVVRQHAPNAKVMAVIKANAYGHGLLRVAQSLNSVDAFAVARVAEGVSLRQAGLQQRIAVLEGFICQAELIEVLNYGLDAVIHSFEQITLLEQINSTEKISVWLKIDTGMNRLGFKSTEFNLAYQRLVACASVKPCINFMTHLANADDLSDTKTTKQINLFKQTVKNLPGESSIANSAGILGWQDAIDDWVRPGIMLYGISPFPNRTGAQLGLKSVMSLHSHIIAIKQLEAGESVGYSSTWVCDRPMRLGVIAIGYGDGYPRHAGSGTPVLVNGKPVPLVGRVSMDMITVDLSSQPDAKLGDLVTLWGEGLPVEEVASCADTIPYTLVCGITRRVEIIEK